MTGYNSIANSNAVAASLVIEELTRHGVRDFVISPGSRSTPLTVAAARHDNTRTTIHFDERGAAFYALGIARESAAPVALICTSGTAVTNYFPAVVEAAAEMIPLILLTADRPKELRNCGANQTIDQVGIFGVYSKYSVDLPCPDDRSDGEFWLRKIDEAYDQSVSQPAGVVHLNFQFREPLALPEGVAVSLDKWSIAEEWKRNKAPLVESQMLSHEVDRKQVQSIASKLSNAKSPLLILGHLSLESDRIAARNLAFKLGCLTFADIRSGHRLNQSESNRIDYYDLWLENNEKAEFVKPDVVLQVGTRFVSKRLMQLLRGWKPKDHLLIDRDPRRHDPSGTVTDELTGNVEEIIDALLQGLEYPICRKPHTSKAINNEYGCLLDEMTSGDDLTEPSVARRLSRMLPEGSNLFLASSMPIRLIDRYAACQCEDVNVYSNRGASGIDGTLASAVGVAAASKRLTTLLTGDLALLHDLNSLALLSKLPTPFCLVLLNNDGGGIFEHLPIAKSRDLFEPFFLTPHGLSFEKVATMFGLSYAKPSDMDKFETEYKRVIDGGGQAIIELTINRDLSTRAQNEITARLSKLDC